MTGVGYVSDITNFIAEVSEVTVYNIKCDIRPCVPKVAFTAYRRSANIHACITGNDGDEFFFISYIGIINSKLAHKGKFDRREIGGNGSTATDTATAGMICVY